MAWLPSPCSHSCMGSKPCLSLSLCLCHQLIHPLQILARTSLLISFLLLIFPTNNPTTPPIDQQPTQDVSSPYRHPPCCASSSRCPYGHRHRCPSPLLQAHLHRRVHRQGSQVILSLDHIYIYISLSTLLILLVHGILLRDRYRKGRITEDVPVSFVLSFVQRHTVLLLRLYNFSHGKNNGVLLVNTLTLSHITHTPLLSFLLCYSRNGHLTTKSGSLDVKLDMPKEFGTKGKDKTLRM